MRKRFRIIYLISAVVLNMFGCSSMSDANNAIVDNETANIEESEKDESFTDRKPADNAEETIEMNNVSIDDAVTVVYDADTMEVISITGH